MGGTQHALGRPARPPQPSATRATETQPRRQTTGQHTQHLDKLPIRRQGRRQTTKISQAEHWRQHNNRKPKHAEHGRATANTPNAKPAV